MNLTGQGSPRSAAATIMRNARDILAWLLYFVTVNLYLDLTGETRVSFTTSPFAALRGNDDAL